MILFTPKKKKFYTHKLFSNIGPGGIEMDMEVWNLAGLSSRLLYAWEAKLGDARTAGEFDPEMLQAVKDSIYMPLGNKTVSKYMRKKTPLKYVKALEKYREQAEALPITKYWLGYDAYITVVYGRYYTWLEKREPLDDRGRTYINIGKKGMV